MTSPGTPTSQVTSSALRATGLGVTYGDVVAPVIDAATRRRAGGRAHFFLPRAATPRPNRSCSWQVCWVAS